MGSTSVSYSHADSVVSGELPVCGLALESSPEGSSVAPPIALTKGPKEFVPGASHTQHRSVHNPFLNHATPAPSILDSMLEPHDLAGLYQRVDALDQLDGVRAESLGEVTYRGRSAPIYALHVEGPPPPEGVPFTEVILSAGVHGDEPAGVAAAVELVRRLRELPGVRATVLMPVNPFGYAQATRNNPDGTNVNRQCLDKEGPQELEVIRETYDAGSYRLAIDLHESSDSPGFFAIHAGGAELAEPVMREMTGTYPVLSETIGPYQVEAPGVAHTSTKGTLKGYAAKEAEWSFTLESPRRLAYAQRVAGLLQMTLGIIERARTAIAEGARETLAA